MPYVLPLKIDGKNMFARFAKVREEVTVTAVENVSQATQFATRGSMMRIIDLQKDALAALGSTELPTKKSDAFYLVNEKSYFDLGDFRNVWHIDGISAQPQDKSDDDKADQKSVESEADAPDDTVGEQDEEVA